MDSSVLAPAHSSFLVDLFPMCLYLCSYHRAPSRRLTKRSASEKGAVIVVASRVFTSVFRLTQCELLRLVKLLWFRRIVRATFTAPHRPLLVEAEAEAMKEAEPVIEVLPGPASTLEGYEPLSAIGKGAYGKVYLVRSKGNKLLYALKMICKAKVLKRESSVSQVMAERIILETVEHPFIVKMHAAFHTPDYLCFALDFCAGGDLFHKLTKHGKFDEDVVAFYMAEVCVALEAMHRKQIVYRDLKPENILIDNEGHIRLTDFGLCKMDVKCENECMTVCGSADYVAPEVLLQSGYGQSVDWYQAGCLTFELLTGAPPFHMEGDHNKQTLYCRILKGASNNFPPDFSHEVEMFIRELLSVRISSRLGCKGGGAMEVKEHAFFRKHNINWYDIESKRVAPPFAPTALDDGGVSNFHQDFTSMPIKFPGALSKPGRLSKYDDPFVDGSEDEDVFHGFDFVRSADL